MNETERRNSDDESRRMLLLYDELRKLAQQKLAKENPGQTLQATALVHEAYLRLNAGKTNSSWDSTGHFFAAAALTMRRILVDNARRKSTAKHGGHLDRIELNEQHLADDGQNPDILRLNEALDQLQLDRPDAAKIANLRYFAGLSVKETAQYLNVSVRTVNRNWAYAKAFLFRIVNRS